MKKYKAAALLMIIHGGLIEVGGCFALIPLLIMGSDLWSSKNYWCNRIIKKQNVGPGIIAH